MRKALNFSVVAAFVATLSVVRMSSADTAWKWREGVGTSITNAADYFDVANWTNGVVEGSSVVAEFPEVPPAYRYIKADRALSLGKMWGALISGSPSAYNSDISGQLLFVSDYGLTLDAKGNSLRSITAYTDVVWPNSTESTTHYSVLCGDLYAPNTYVLGMSVDQRLDRYAKAAGETRTGYIYVQTIGNSYGRYRVYAPESTPTNVTGTWTMKEGSPYLFRTSALRHALPVGTLVTGEGIPAGAFLKRVFTGTSIEISAPAETTGEAAVTFAAFRPNASARVDKWRRHNAEASAFQLAKYAAEDNLELEIGQLYAGISAAYPYYFDTPSGFFPGTFVIENGSANDLRLYMTRCHVRFKPYSGGTGFPNGLVKMNSASADIRFTVPTGTEATFQALTNAVGKLTKDGGGSLATPVVGNVSFKALTVAEGTLSLSLPENATATSLVVSNGATLRLPAGGLTVGSFQIAPGATIVGPGKITCTVSELMPLPGVTLTDGAEVVNPGLSATACYEPPVTNVVGNPLLWADFSRESTLTIGRDANDKEVVNRINDVRGAEYWFATNLIAVGPQLIRDANGNPQHVYFKREGSYKPGVITNFIDTEHALVWNRQATNVRAVFKVTCLADGGGQFLGNTVGSYNDWLRAAETHTYNAALFYTGTISSYPQIANGTYYANGVRRSWRDGYPYPGGGSAKANAYDYIPQLAEFHTAGDARANCFGYQGAFVAEPRAGWERIYECIVYTNALTQTERMQVAGYLMKKWLNAEIEYSCSDTNATVDAVDLSAGAVVGVAAGDSGRIRTAAGAGTLVKASAGDLYLDDFADPAASLEVRGGRVTVKSLEITRDMLPEGAYLHVDATAADTIAKDGSGKVTTWQDVRGAGYQTLTRLKANIGKASVVTDCVNGLPMVRFETLEATADTYSPALKYTPCSDLKSVFMVLGPTTHGGTLIGNCSDNPFLSGGKMYGLWRYGGGNYDGTLLKANEYSDQYVIKHEVAGGTFARLNGADIVLANTKLTFAGDVVGFATYEGIYGDCFAQIKSNYNTIYGGKQDLGEAILYREALSHESMLRVESYLRRKWQNAETPGYRAARMHGLSVAAGAELVVYGNRPVTVDTLTGAGGVDGDVTVASAGGIVRDGLAAPMTVTGTLTLPADGTLTVSGVDPGAVAARPYALATCGTLAAPSLTGWTVTFPDATHATRRRATLRADNGTLYLDIMQAGLGISFR